MNQQELMQILPHRDNMLLIDEAELIEGKAHGKKYITGDEFFLKGHFPEKPVVPGVILCEILAQSVCVCLTDKMEENTVPMFTGLNNVKFRQPVLPGDTVETECEITRIKHPFYFAKGKATVNGTLCVSAEFSFALAKETEEA
ncbi:MAG: beta-hydroxyacyl-ACP dehydratase [Ruminococcaceae bacterium]|nr:beta-hydroxyacyl-ACP dehydratase [Oscillospiraceae bacterium]